MLYEVCTIHKVAKMRGEPDLWSVWFFSAVMRAVEEGNTEVKTMEKACSQCLRIAYQSLQEVKNGTGNANNTSLF